MDGEPWLPEPDDDSAPFFEGARQGRLRLQCCSECETWMFPLKRRCQNCGGTRLEWRDASGTGTIYAHARLRRAYHPRHADRLPLILAWVDIPEGVRVMTNIVGADPATVRTGDAVRVVFENLPGGMAIPVFEPV